MCEIFMKGKNAIKRHEKRLEQMKRHPLFWDRTIQHQKDANFLHVNL